MRRGGLQPGSPPPRPLRGHPSSGRRGGIFYSPPFQGGVARSAGVVRAGRRNLAQSEARVISRFDPEAEVAMMCPLHDGLRSL